MRFRTCEPNMNLANRVIDARLCINGLLHRKRLQVCSPPVFVVGTGRSGTHWLGHILQSHPSISISIEQQPMFDWSRAMALDPAQVSALLPRLVRRYQFAQAASWPKRYADKSHPNLWVVTELAAQLPDARFIGVSRGVYAVVASMLRHRGVQRSIERWRDYPVPNRFLGITESNREAYASMSLVERCTLRWIAHQQELKRLGREMRGAFLLLEYESLQRDTLNQLTRLQTFLDLEQRFGDVSVKSDSLDKWREQLTPQQIQAIDRCCAAASAATTDS